MPSKLDDVTQFEDIIIKADTNGSGRITRLRDVARVELGAQQYSQTFKLNGQPSAGLAIFQLPEANALDVAKRVEKRMEQLQPAFPPGMTWDVPFDTTKFVAAAIHEVYKTLIEAAVLVLIVILVFLQDWRATLVPATTVPVTIIGAFAAMAALGFSVNLPTLFAIILAIGIVVDDAIVVVEGAAKHIEHGLTPHDATIKAMDELIGPIIGITLVLMAVFVPTAFLPGLTRPDVPPVRARHRRDRALISAINAMTLKPAQCALWLRPTKPPEQRNIFYRGFNRVYDALRGTLCRADRGAWSPTAALMALIVAGLVGPRGVRPEPRADRLPADRGPGLFPHRRAASRRRRRSSARRAPSTMSPSASRAARRRQGGRDRRARRAQRQREPCQRRHRLRHPQGLVRAQEGRGPARPLHWDCRSA